MARKAACRIVLLFPVLMLLSGCAAGERAASPMLAYGIAAVLALLLVVGYCTLIRERNKWLLLLFCSVAVVNTGYFLLSVSSSLEAALMANRLSYLGSVFLPLSMLMTILHVCRLQHKKWLPYVLIGVSLLVFLVAATPGWLDIYYQQVSLVIENGVAVLKKEYGPWHCIYLYFLLLYMGAMVCCVFFAAAKKRVDSTLQAIMLCAAVLLNIGVWLVGQFVKFGFEMLSLSYIISEVFLLGLYLMQQETERLLAAAQANEQDHSTKPTKEEITQPDGELLERLAFFKAQLPRLTPAERNIVDLYQKGLPTRQILQTLQITENTLKYHNRNIYSKLGVSSRKELLMISCLCMDEAK